MLICYILLTLSLPGPLISTVLAVLRTQCNDEAKIKILFLLDFGVKFKLRDLHALDTLEDMTQKVNIDRNVKLYPIC